VSERIGPLVAAAGCLVPFGPPSPHQPNSGSIAGGTHVTITGAGFAAGAAVTIGGVAATGISVNSTTITATTAAHATGGVDVVVTNPASVASTLTRAFSTPRPRRRPASSRSPCRCSTPATPTVRSAARDQRRRAAHLNAPPLRDPSTAKSISANLTIVSPAPRAISPRSRARLSPGDDRNRFPHLPQPLQQRGDRARDRRHRNLRRQQQSSSSLHLIVDINGYFQ